MPLNRFAILDRGHQKFGALVKEWARGTKPIPGKDPEEFKQYLEAEGIDLHWPEKKEGQDHTVTEINIFQGVPHRIDIRLPPPSFIAESEAYLKTNGYPLPRYYEDLFGTGPVWSNTTALDFHNARIGDYTVANCA